MFIAEYVRLNKRFYAWNKVFHSCFNMPGGWEIWPSLEALTGGAFDRLNRQRGGEFDQNFSKKSNAPGFARGGGMGGLELTGTFTGISKFVEPE